MDAHKAQTLSPPRTETATAKMMKKKKKKREDDHEEEEEETRCGLLFEGYF